MECVRGSLEKRKKLIEYYLGLDYRNIPPRILEITRKCLIDAIACAIGGCQAKSAKIILDYCSKRFPGNESQVWCSGKLLSAPGAAFVNAGMASVLDIDDGSRTALGHPGGVIIPSVVAIGQKINCSIKDLLVAIVLGYDMGIRFGEILLQITSNRFYGTGTWAIVGAAAGISKLSGLSPQDFLNSIGVAEAYASLSPVMKSIENGSSTKETMGWAAFSSIISVELAQKGFSGVESMLYHEEESQNYSGLDDLGEEFRIFRTYFKRYSACRWTHAPMEAVGSLKNRYSFSPGDIRQVTIKTHEKALSCSTVIPTNEIQAEYSIPFAVANMIISGQMGPDQLSDENIHSQEVLEMAKKVRMAHTQVCEEMFPAKNTALAEIELLDGTLLRSELVSPRGDYDDPLTMEEIIQKYHWLTGRAWDERHRKAVLDRITGTEHDLGLSVNEIFL